MGNWWCCKSDFGEHEPSCENYVPPTSTSDCSGAEAGQSDAERSGDPSRSGDDAYQAGWQAAWNVPVEQLDDAAEYVEGYRLGLIKRKQVTDGQ